MIILGTFQSPGCAIGTKYGMLYTIYYKVYSNITIVIYSNN